MKKLFTISSITLLAHFTQAQGVNFQWATPLQYSGTVTGEGHYIGADAMGNVYTSGTFYTSNTDFDPGPAVFNLTLHGNNDVFVTKYDANGNFIWAVNVGGPKDDISSSIIVDASGYVYVAGFFEDTADFDPGPGVFNIYAATTWQDMDIFILKLDPVGNFVWAKQFGGDGGQYGCLLALDNLGNVYSTGHYNGPTDFDPGPGTYNLTTAGEGDIFISKLDASGNFAWAIQMGGPLFDVRL